MIINNQYSDIADANSDGNVNITDIVSLVNEILS